MLTLYQFPLSHYCEKARWALEYKNLDYTKVNLLPGIHQTKIKKLSGKSHLPVLKHKDKIVQGSAQIIDYLDSAFSRRNLTPDEHQLKTKAMEWEHFADSKLGPQVRQVVYHIMLDYPELLIPMFTQDGPFYGPFLMKRMFPAMRKKMREYMEIDEANAAKSNTEILKSVDDLANHYDKHQFMIGDQFSRADLTAAALLAPIAMPEKYGVDWPEEIPQRLQEFSAQFDGRLEWLKGFYKHYR